MMIPIEHADKLRESARRIEIDGTQSQVGLTPTELREAALALEMVNACFNAASGGMTYEEVSSLLGEAREYTLNRHPAQPRTAPVETEVDRLRAALREINSIGDAAREETLWLIIGNMQGVAVRALRGHQLD